MQFDRDHEFFTATYYLPMTNQNCWFHDVSPTCRKQPPVVILGSGVMSSFEKDRGQPADTVTRVGIHGTREEVETVMTMLDIF